MNPGRRARARKAPVEKKARLAHRGNTGPEGKADNLHVLDFCVCLFKAAGHRQTRNSAVPEARLSFSSSMAAMIDVSSTKTAEESRPKAQMPRVSIAKVCHELLNPSRRRWPEFCVSNLCSYQGSFAAGSSYVQPLI